MLIYPGVTPLDVIGPLEVFGFANRLTKQKLYEISPSRRPPNRCRPVSALPSCRLRDGGPCGADRHAAGLRRRRAERCNRPREIFDWLRHSGAARAPLRLDLHRRLRARQRRADRRQARHDPLGARRRARAAQSDHKGRDRPDLHPRRQALHLRRHLGRDRSRARPAGGRSRPRFRAEGRALSRAVPEALRRPDPVLDACCRRSSRRSRRSRRCSTGATTISTATCGSRAGEAGRHERAQLHPRVPRGHRPHAGGVRVVDPPAGRAPPARGDRACAKTIAQRCGLGSASAMRRVFIRQLSVAPAHYRDKFRTQSAMPAAAKVTHADHVHAGLVI